MPALPAELQSYRAELLRLSEEVRMLGAGLSEAQWHWTPDPARWSIAQCIDHLNTIHTLLLPRLSEAMRRARERGYLGRGRFRYNWFDRMFIDALQPDARPNMRAPALYRPQARPPDGDLLPRFDALQQELIATVEAADGLDLRRIKVASPVSALLRISLGAWFAAIVAHQWNHLRQAQRVREESGFPSS
jgi:hypothetical protein